ncbi:MAG TPA: NBR1-Ig-like domain-containing protein [Anaerolineales bacterium]|nr:NBR1-Ig-like domain-containing protein [Anaerolineales bacterium]
MSEVRIHKIFAVIVALILLMSACVPSQPPESSISTAVAQTVEAQDTLEALSTATLPVVTDTPSVLPSAAVTATMTPITGAVQGSCEVGASLVSETYPDGTIVNPGETFTKIWNVQNTGTCYWDASWQLVFYNGDLMDGIATYSFPQPTEPGQVVEVPIILRAPAETGTYTGEWMLKTPWGTTFGVGSYSVPLSVSIVSGSTTPANRKTESVFDVTSVTYSVDRRCAPANTFYTITANVTTNGPLKVNFSTFQSDGHRENNYRLEFTEATTKSFSWEWSQHKDSSPNPRWAQVIMMSPDYREFDKVVLPSLCEFD